jgi:signal transduction histidine kinase
MQHPVLARWFDRLLQDMTSSQDEIRDLRRGLRDLVALTTLPAVWSESKPQEIADSLADILVSRLHIDFIYVSLPNVPDGSAIDLIKTPDERIFGLRAWEIGQAFRRLFPDESVRQIHTLPHPLTGESLSAVIVPFGYGGNDGYVVAGVLGRGQLTEVHRLLLSVAANEAVTTLRQAQLIGALQAANQSKDLLLANEQDARSEAQRATEHITQLQALTSKLSRSMSVQQVAHVILEAGEQLFHSPRGAVYSYRDHGQSVYMLDQFGLDTVQMSPRNVSLLDALPVTDAIRTGELVWIESHEAFISRYPTMERRIRVENLQAVAAIPFLIDDQVLGCLKLHFDGPRPLTERDIILLSAVAQQCALALERAYLTEHAQIAAAIEERQRLARELHDAVSQVLFASTLSAETAVRAWERGDSDRVHEQLVQIVTLNRAAMGEMRTLLLELRPESLVKTGLKQLLTQLVEGARGRQEIDAEFTVEGREETLPADVIITVYRIAQESINNILRHSGASRFFILLRYETDYVELMIRDNGGGFDVAAPSSGLGLGSMRERAKLVDATLDITSESSGTTVHVRWKRP